MDRLVAGRYRLVEKLGAGATSSVFRAHDETSGAALAVKIIHPHVTNARTATERLLREAQTIAKLKHPHCVRLLDYGIDSDEPYLVLELCEGMDLERILKRDRKLTLGRALQIAIDLCDVLAAAHRIGVVHRDLKPANVVVLRDGSIKVLDFGLARLMPAELEDTIPRKLTQPGTLLGTPTHMAPEQLRSPNVDARADIYACGVIIYEMLTGELPITADNAVAVMMAVTKTPPVPPSKYLPDIAPELEMLVLRCLEKKPDERIQTAVELRQALVSMLADEHSPPSDPTPEHTIRRHPDDAPTIPISREMAAVRDAIERGEKAHRDDLPTRRRVPSEDLPTLRVAETAEVREATTRRMAKHDAALRRLPTPPRSTPPRTPQRHPPGPTGGKEQSAPPGSAPLPSKPHTSAQPSAGFDALRPRPASGRVSAKSRAEPFELSWGHVAATIAVMLLVVAVLWAFV